MAQQMTGVGGVVRRGGGWLAMALWPAAAACSMVVAIAPWAGAVAEGAVAEPQADPPSEAASEEAERLLREASEALDAAAGWLTGAAAEFSETGEARRWLDQVLAGTEPSERTGLRLARMASGGSRVAGEAGEAEVPGGVSGAGPVGVGGRVEWVELADVEGALPKRLVLLVHGLDEPGTIWDEMTPALLAEKFDVARLEYPNDQRIADSADFMAEALRDLALRGVERVDIVAHSMGGLVARDVLTREAYYAGLADAQDGLPDVGRLITIGTPHEGSPWADLQALSEMREQLARWIDSGGKDVGALMGFSEDGSGEAAVDLKPDSAFLQDLNARPLPEGVKITCIRAVMAPDEAEAALGVLEWPLAKRLLSEEQIAQLEADGEALVRRLGDGVVPHESAALEGVEDVVDVEANHRSVLLRGFLNGARRAMGREEKVAPSIPVVVDRLKQDEAVTR